VGVGPTEALVELFHSPFFTVEEMTYLGMPLK
jgi:hypothetical protein